MPRRASRWPTGSGTLAAVVVASSALLLAFAPACSPNGFRRAWSFEWAIP
jgi:hypothetical protein